MPRSNNGRRRQADSGDRSNKIRELRLEDFKSSDVGRSSSERFRKQYHEADRHSQRAALGYAEQTERPKRSSSEKVGRSRSASVKSSAKKNRPAKKTDKRVKTTAKAVGKRTGAVLTKAKPKRTFDAMVLPKRSESNFAIIACVILLMCVGLVMVTSSSYYYAYTTLGDSMYFFRRQLVWMGIGLAAMFAVKWVPLHWYKKLSVWIYAFSVLCSLLVLFVGNEVNGSTRWLGVGSLSFQPAELAKIATAIMLASYCDDHQETIKSRKSFLIMLGLLGVPTLLVAIENLSSAVIIAAIGLVIMFIGGARKRYYFTIVLPVALCVVGLIVLPLIIPVENMPSFLQGFWEKFMYRTFRIKAWLDPFAYAQGDGYQTVQSLYAVGSGGIFGRGLGQSIQKLGYIPEAYNDIIFAIICEELGLFGALVVVLLFIMFTWNGIQISYYAPNRFTSLLAVGIVGQIALQAILNIAVNTNTVPPTGVTLPFISYGGSSMLFLMGSIGILLDISSFSRRNEDEE